MNTLKASATFFPTPAAFRAWLEKYHTTEQELLVGFYKLSSHKPSMTWSESVDQALCFGWIDGVRRSIDAESYCIRFTPRRPDSIWSTINIEKVKALTKAGLMTPAGQQAYRLRTEGKSHIYAHEHKVTMLAKAYEMQFQQHPLAWDFFNQQAPSYKKVTIHWIMSAKQEKTKLSRLERTIQASAQGKRIG